MNFQKTLLAASIAVLPLFMAHQAVAAGPMMSAPKALASPQEVSSLMAKLSATRSAKGLDQNHGFAITAQHPGAEGKHIVRAAHTFKGVRVFASDSVVVTDNAGKVVSESSSDRRAKLGHSANALAGAADFDVKPSLSTAAAIDTVVKKVGPAARHAVAPSAELIIYPILENKRAPGAEGKAENKLNALDVVETVIGYELAYLVQTRMEAGQKSVHHDTIVSARTGKILKQWNALQTVTGSGKSQYNGTVPLSTTAVSGGFQMKDPLRGVGGMFGGMAITNANHGASTGTIYSDTDNVWGDGLQYVSGGSTTNANGQTAAVNAMWGLMNTYDALKNVLGWQSLDGRNTATHINVHVNTNYDNATYNSNCKCMNIGDGGTSFNNLGSIDVIGHEMGHGVTDATSRLIYSGESGGLNESHSDIQGEMVEAYARAGGTGNVIPNSGNDWMTGQEISKSGKPLRWLYKPSLDGRSPDAWYSGIGSIDVHLSSGPNNRMFYFLSQGSNATSSSPYYSQYLTQSPRNMTGIGSDKAFRIWFKALTTKFNASTNYANARLGVIAAATDLYGATSPEVTAVKRAYAAINVGADVPETPTGALAISSQPASVSVAAGGTATFSVTVGGGSGSYNYQWLRNGVAITGANAATYSFTTVAGDNGAQFSVRITDTAGATVTSSAATLTVGVIVGSEKIVNGGFEVGTSPWTGTTTAIGTFTGQTAFEGTRYAWLGGNGRTSTESLAQTVTIPATATSANLTFALHIDTAETTTTRVYDRLTVTVKNAAGTSTLATLGTYSNLNKAAGYKTYSFSLAAYKGQTVQLHFNATEDYSLQSSFVVDKVSLQVQ